MSLRQARGWVASLSAAYTSLMVAGCGTSAPTTPTPAASFLTGTWRGTLTISRSGEPEVSGQTTWSFEPVPGSNGQTFRSAIQTDNAWLPIETVGATAITPTSEPPGQIATYGSYMSPRGCLGSFASTGDVQARSIDASFVGVDCDQGAGRMPFEGRVRLTK